MNHRSQPSCGVRRRLFAGASALFAALCVSPASAADPQSYWKRTPFVKQEALDRGFIGGEGQQLILSMAVSKTSTTPGVPDLMLIGTDVGGLQRSIDGGDTWQPSMRGYGPEGAYSIAIDPRNPNRAIAMASRNTTANKPNQLGLWLTTNKGVSWTRVWTPPSTIAFGGGPKYQLAYDYLSYNATLGYCTRIYWSSPWTGGENFGGCAQTGQGGLYRSDSGGASGSWTLVNASTNVSGCFLALDLFNTVGQTYPRLYVGGANGLRYSDDGGSTFTVATIGGSTTRKISGLTTNYTADRFVSVCTGYAIYNSTDKGVNWANPGSAGLPTGTPGASDYLNNIQCAPNNSQLMILGHWRTNFDQNTRYYSTNRGASWTASTKTVDLDLFESNLYGLGDVWIVNAWYPSASTADPLTDRVYGGSKSRVYRSNDRGASFQWHNDGNTLINGREIAFNVHNPAVLALPFQDHRAAFTTNATTTGTPAWKSLNPPAPNSHSSGAYAFSATNMFVGTSTAWDGPFTLRRTTDGGQNWTTIAGVSVTPGANELQRGAYGDPVNSAIAFWYNYRTTNSGANWTAMSGTYAPTVVLTHDNSGAKPLFGAKGNQVVKSTDRGATWTLVTTMTGFTHVTDLAYDHVNARLYIAADDPSTGYAQFANLFRYQGGVLTDITGSLPEDPIRTGKAASTVAVDPTDPNVVYAGRLWNVHMSQASVYRSTNGGVNWTIMTPQPGTTYLDGGGHRTFRIRVHPTTRTAWVATMNTGLWRIPYPTP